MKKYNQLPLTILLIISIFISSASLAKDNNTKNSPLYISKAAIGGYTFLIMSGALGGTLWIVKNRASKRHQAELKQQRQELAQQQQQHQAELKQQRQELAQQQQQHQEQLTQLQQQHQAELAQQQQELKQQHQAELKQLGRYKRKLDALKRKNSMLRKLGGELASLPELQQPMEKTADLPMTFSRFKRFREVVQRLNLEVDLNKLELSKESPEQIFLY